MSNAEDTPDGGFARPAGTPGAPAPGTPHGAPWGPVPEPVYPRPQAPAVRPVPDVPHPLEVPHAPGVPQAAPTGAAATPPEGWPAVPATGPVAPLPGAPGRRGPSPARVRSGEPGPRRRGPSPARVRSGESAPRSPGLRARVPAPLPVPGRAAPRATAGPHRPGAVALAQVPYLVVLACTVGGIVWAWRGSHAVGNGAGVVGGALLAAAIARLVLPQSSVGLLASRRRFADVLALGILGAGLLVLALVLPPT